MGSERKLLRFNESRSLLKSVPFERVLLNANPDLPPLVLHDILGIVSSLMPYMTADPEQAQMILRGGVFRSLYYGNTMFDNAFYLMWNKDLALGERSDFSSEVLRHMAGYPKDVDIRLNQANVTIGEAVVRPWDKFILSIISAHLQERGWIGRDSARGETHTYELEKDEFVVQLRSFEIGKTAKRLHHTAIFRNKQSGEVIQEVGFADIARTVTEMKEDVRCLNYGRSAEEELSADIWLQENTGLPVDQRLMVSYQDTVDDDLEYQLLLDQFGKGLLGIHKGFSEQYAESLTTAVRAVNWLSGHWDFLRTFSHVPFSQFLTDREAWIRKKYAELSPVHAAEARVRLRSDVASQKESIRELIVPLLSDMLFLSSADPHIGLTFSYYTGLLNAVNLGEVIQSSGQLKTFFENLSQKTDTPPDKDFWDQTVLGIFVWYQAGCLDRTDPLVLLDVLKDISYTKEQETRLRTLGIYPPDMPRTVTSLLELLLPIGLTMDDVAN